MSDVLIKPETTDGSSDNEDRLAHIVTVENQMQGYVNGNTITALCGYTWVPSVDPKDYPVCPKCKEIMERIKAAQEGLN